MRDAQIDRMVSELIKKSEYSKEKASFIRHYDAYCIDADYVKSIVEDMDFFYFAHEFSLNGIQPAYEPFLDWAKELYRQSNAESPRAFLEKSQVCPLHYEMFESFFETGECKRWEDILLHEIKYEQKRMTDDIINIFKYMSKKKPIFLLLNRVHFAQSSTLRFLRNMLSHLNECSVYILGAYNEEYRIRSYLADKWERLTELLETQRFVVSRVSEENSQEYFDSDFVPDDSKLADYAVCLNNMVEMGAYNQANYYLSFIFQKYQSHCEDVGYDLWIRICLLYIRNCLYLNDISNAIRIAESIREKMIENGNSQRELFMISYYIGMAHIYNSRNKLADRYAEECSKILEHYEDEMLTMRLLILKDVNLYLGFDAQSMVDEPPIIDETLNELLRKHNFWNHLSYIYCNCIANTLNSIRNEGLKDRKYYREGLEIAEQKGNDNCIIIFYTNRVVLASSLGRYDLPEGYYKQILGLIEKGGNLRDLCNNYNGMGYFTCVEGSYEKSNDYYTNALKLAYEIRDLKLVAETLYNKCITAFMAKDYQNAIQYIELSIDIVEDMGYMRFIGNWSKLYGLAAIANHYDNNGYSCSFHFEKMKRFLMHLLTTDDESKYAFWDDDLFLYYLVRSLLEKTAGRFERAVEELEHAKKHLLRTPGFYFFGYPVWAREMADCLDKLGQAERRRDILKETIEALTEKNYLPEIPELKALMEKREFTRKTYEFPLDKDIQIEVKSLYNEATMQKSNKIFRTNSEFLVTWQGVLAENKPLAAMCENAITIATNHFGADNICIFGREDGHLKPTLSYAGRAFGENDLLLIERFAKAYPNGFVVSRIEKEFYVFRELLDVFDIDEVVSFMMVPYIRGGTAEGTAIAYVAMRDNLRMNSFLLNEEDLNIFKIVYRQLVDFIEKKQASELIHTMNEKLLNANKKLEEMAVKDALTSIYNRQGLAMKVEELEENGGANCAIIYFDLDNFKYYNDTFGHDVGDLVLVQFAHILRELAPEQGIPIRYGGDEFLLLLPGEGEEKGVELAKRFYGILERDGYYIPNIEQKLGRKVEIPDEKRISSSIGIAAASVGACDIQGAIMHADEALYRIKKTTKKNYITWSRIADEEGKHDR